MKKLLSILAIAALAFACKKSNSSTTNTQLIGKWYAVKDVYSVTDKTGKTTIIDTSIFNHTDNMTFNSDKTGIDVQGSSSMNFNYTSSSTSVVISYTSYPYNGSMPWNIPIRALTNTTLELYYVIGPDQTDGHSENHDITYLKQ